ncbi:MAG: hypothetical protein LH606_11855, partial [Cytophagaceae bacterium]|nr:hypothetical protein [Cytophagaceae bacterium]
TNVLPTLVLAERYLERIHMASSDQERKQYAEEWHQTHASFTPEQKAEVQPLLDEIKESILARFAEMDGLVADFTTKHPDLAHLFEEK